MSTLFTNRYFYRIAVLTLLSMAITINPAKAATAENYMQYMDGAEKAQHFTGTVLVARDGKTIFAGGFGRADFESGRLNFPSTRLAIGSVTKQFTAVVIMQLIEQGKLSLSDPIAKYLPEYPEDVANKVTIRHLLTHTSGVVNFTNTPVYATWKDQDVPLDAQVNTIASMPLEFEPGTQFKYSNSGYKLLEAIIVKVTGMPWSEYITTNILKPVGMSASGCDLRLVDDSIRAFGYETDDSNSPKRVELPFSSIPGGAGAIFSTVEDLLKWDQALYTEKTLKRSSLDAVFTPFLGNYGYGWMIDSLAGQQRYWHDGLIDGFTSMFVRMPKEKLCIVVLANNHTLDAHRIANALSAIALGLPYDVPVIKSPIAANSAAYSDYVGAYELGNGQYRTITTDDGRLLSQRTGGAQMEILPEGPDKFYYAGNNATFISFIRDDSGKVIAHSIHQEGVDSRHEKASAEIFAKLQSKFATASVDPALYDRYVGEYRLTPLFAITIERKSDRIFAQATGQAQFEIFPKSETRYFFKVVDAEIEFVLGPDSKADSLILFQGGIEQKAPRVK